MSLDVVTFGEAMLLLVADRVGPIEDAEGFHKRTAGAETNVAIGLSRLGLKVGWSATRSIMASPNSATSKADWVMAWLSANGSARPARA